MSTARFSTYKMLFLATLFLIAPSFPSSPLESSSLVPFPPSSSSHGQFFADSRAAVREMFYHAFDSYMIHAFPSDEVKPISCTARDRPPKGMANPRGTLDDHLGNYSITLIDALDTLAIFGDVAEFERSVALVTSMVHFHRDVTVNVFEFVIRVIGGLLSAHTLAEQLLVQPPGGGGGGSGSYGGELLALALDAGERVLPAFSSPTRIPYSMVNLLHGVPEDASSRTCLAGAGTLILELGTLSRLSGRPEFERAARDAVRALWMRRTKLGLVPSGVDVQTGEWTERHASIGAGSDSFYEYLLKAWQLLGEREYLHMFNESLDALETYSKNGGIYHSVWAESGKRAFGHIEGLAAFWPGVLAQSGRVRDAHEAYGPFQRAWERYGGMPEAFHPGTGVVVDSTYARGYPLRPELAESSLLLYHRTGDSKFVDVGRAMVRDLGRYKAPCGYAAAADVTTGRLDDRMDSFFLSETCKYLYLLFSPSHPLLSARYDGGGVGGAEGSFPRVVFSTEGHPLPVLPRIRGAEQRYAEFLIQDAQRKPSAIAPPSTTSTHHRTRPPRPRFTHHIDGDAHASGILEIPVRWGAPRHQTVVRVPVFDGGRTASLVATLTPNAVVQLQLVVSLGTRGSDDAPSHPSPVHRYVAVQAEFGAHGASSEHSHTPTQLVRYPEDACQPATAQWEPILARAMVVVSRGGCTFVQKALMLQRAGAAAMVVLNTRGHEAREGDGRGDADAQAFVMSAADQPTDQVTIPCVMISANDGDHLEELLGGAQWFQVFRGELFQKKLEHVQISVPVLKEIAAKMVEEKFGCKEETCMESIDDEELEFAVAIVSP